MKYAHRTTFASKSIVRGIIVQLGRGQITVEDPDVQRIIHDPHPLFGAKVWLYPGVSAPHPYTQDMLNGLAMIQRERFALGMRTNIQIGYKTYYWKIAKGHPEADIEWGTFPAEILATTSRAGWDATLAAFTKYGWHTGVSWGDDTPRYFKAVNEGSGSDWVNTVPLWYAEHSFTGGSTTVVMASAIIDLAKPGAMDYIAGHLPRLKHTIQERTDAATGHGLQFDWVICHKSKQYEWYDNRPTRQGLSNYAGINPETNQWERMPYDNAYTESQNVCLAPVRPLYLPGSMVLVPEFAAATVNALWGDIPLSYQSEGAYAELYNQLALTLARAGVWVYVQNWAPWTTSDQMDGWMSEEGMRATLGYSSYGGEAPWGENKGVEGVVLDSELSKK